MSDSVSNCKHSLQKLKTQVLILNSLEALRFSGIIGLFSMHGIIWFHALPCMESYDSMRGIAWKVCRPWFHVWNRMESHGSYASMHGISWKPYEFGSGYSRKQLVENTRRKTRRKVTRRKLAARTENHPR